jgi:hypothetical protein
MTERRKHPRHKSLLQGRLAFNNGRSSIDCLIRDMSDGGARLSFASPVTLPEVAELQIPSKHENHPVHVRWGNGDEYGVTFTRHTGAESTDSGEHTAPSDIEGRLNRLEADVMWLRRSIAELRAEQSERRNQVL